MTNNINQIKWSSIKDERNIKKINDKKNKESNERPLSFVALYKNIVNIS